jgi:membrane protein DedA with SNARE-associated domain
VADEVEALPVDATGPRRKRPASVALVTFCAVFYLLGFVGGWLGPSLVDRPNVLLALDSRNRHLLAAIGAGISAAPFFLIAFARLTIADPFFYRLGMHHGEKGIAWLERQTQGNLGYIGWIQKWFLRAGWVVVLLMPNLLVCTLAGTCKMPFKRFAALDVVGTAGRLALFWFAGQQIRPELEDAVAWVQRYQWWLVGGLFVVSMMQSSRKAVRQARETTGTEVTNPPPAEPPLHDR